MKGEIDPYLWLLSILPDCSHECKNLMAAFLYWWLKCGDERSNLSRLRTLRNRSKNTTQEKFRELVPKNDHFKNKDRQHPSAVLEPSKQNLIDELKSVKTELDKFTQENRIGMIPSPTCIAIANYG